MASASRFMIGADVECTDGICGEVIRVVVDPVARDATHLVVEPKHRRGLGRLVSLALVDATGGHVRLTCTRAEFENLDPGEITRCLPGNGADADYGPGHSVSWRHLRTSVAGAVMRGGTENVAQLVTDDRIPMGEVAIRRDEHVHCADGDLGRVQGLVIDSADRHITHILAAERHLWGRRLVAIPIEAVRTIDHDIRLTIRTHDVHEQTRSKKTFPRTKLRQGAERPPAPLPSSARPRRWHRTDDQHTHTVARRPCDGSSPPSYPTSATDTNTETRITPAGSSTTGSTAERSKRSPA